MNTTFIINGGAGRVIASIPALEKYARLNPNDDFTVLVYGWEVLFWSHPLLQNRTFSIGQKGAFNQYIKNNRVICPEPYYVYGYYNQKLSLAQAFDEVINNTNDHSNLEPPHLYVSNHERKNMQSLIKMKKEEFKKSKVLVIQPYGSGMALMNGRPFDSSQRSMDVDEYLKLVKRIAEKNKDVLIFFFGDNSLRHPGDDITVDMTHLNVDLRFFITLVDECDYFVGVDSVGQHIARALNKDGLVLMGSTDEVNVSYPDFFTIYRKKGMQPTYSPIRLSGIDCEFADRMNDGIMNFSNKEIDEIADIVNKSLYQD